MKKLKIGIIGLGCRGSSLLETSLAFEEADIVAVCDKYADRADKAANRVKEKRGVSPTVYLKEIDFFADGNIEVVIIATPWDEHIRMAISAMRAGKITAMEVGGAYDIEECWELVHVYEQTQTPFMLLENCCFDRFELLTTALVRAGKLGEIVHCHGAYGHDLRKEVLGGRVNRHYRLDNYLKRNCENYPTHELGPISKLLDVNRGNRMLSLVSVASRAAGLAAFADSESCPDKTLRGKAFAQGDVVETIIQCANGETVSLKLDTTLPRYYSREFTVSGTKGLCVQEANLIMLEGEADFEKFFEPYKTIGANLNSAEKYTEYLPEIWRKMTEKQTKLGHGGMDYIMLKTFFCAARDGEKMPVDVYDAATWMCVSALSEISVKQGGAPQEIPDFTRGKWMLRQRKDVMLFPKN